MRVINNQKGFTLIEMLLVVLLLALTIGLTGDMLLSLIRSNTKTQVMNEIEQQANFVTLKLEKELRDALDANIVETNTLEISLRSGSKVYYRLNSNYLQRSIVAQAGPYVDLTSRSNPGGVAVSCSGDCFQITGTDPKVVKTNMLFNQIQATTGVTTTGEVKIESSIVIRSSYK